MVSYIYASGPTWWLGWAVPSLPESATPFQWIVRTTGTCKLAETLLSFCTDLGKTFKLLNNELHNILAPPTLYNWDVTYGFVTFIGALLTAVTTDLQTTTALFTSSCNIQLVARRRTVHVPSNQITERFEFWCLIGSRSCNWKLEKCKYSGTPLKGHP